MKNDLEFYLEGLENRRMLAVDVSMTGSRLDIVGDNFGNTVDVNGTGVAGGMQVFVDGDLVGTFNGVESIKANLRGGDDFLQLSAIDISGNVRARLGSGADDFDLDTTPTNHGVGIGVTHDVLIGGDVRASMGGNDGDFIEWDGNGGQDLGIEIGGKVVLRGASDIDLDGDGGTLAVEDSDIDIGNGLIIALSRFGGVDSDGNEIDVDDVNVTGTTRIRGSSADDRMDLTDSRFEGKTFIRLVGGDDTLDLAGSDNQNLFDQRVVFNGGGGSGDTLVENASNIFNDVEKQISFELIVS